jgi:small nuclear ribonucleoprotein (snRNP)-like protein
MADDLVYANSEFNYSNVSSVTTNFNVNPYYDDFSDKNNYYKILFKPGFAVQARELTQIQSILQDQIQKFGQHIFKEGSMVLGGKFKLDNRANYVKINDKDLLGNDIDIKLFQGQTITGQTTGVQAYVNIALDGTEGTDKPKTLYVTYTGGNADTDEVHFAENEPLVANVGTIVVGNNAPVGYGSVFTVNEGVRFCKQHFIHHDTQTVVVDRYDIKPTCKVGFVLVEEIINSAQDSSLLDPALESSNYAAPGADRFKITPVLTRLDINDDSGYPDYVNLYTIDNGTVTEVNERPVYNIVRDEIARRTYDESGDYYVKGFNTVIEEHLDINKNGGYLTPDKGGNSQLLSIQVEAGTAYVKGYEINKLVTEFLTVDKSSTYSNVNSQKISSRVGSYVTVKEAVGAWNVNVGQEIDLYDTAQNRISKGVSSTASQTGRKIGTARIKSISADSRNSELLGAPNATMQLHLFGVSMLGSNSFSDVKSVYYNNPSTADMSADLVLRSGKSKLLEPYNGLLYYTGSNHTKAIRSADGTIDTTFLFKKTSDISISSVGTFSLTSTISNESFGYGTGTLSDNDLTDIFLTLNSSVSLPIQGTALSGAGTTTLGGASTYFGNLNVGDKIGFSGNTTTYVISSIASDTSLTVTTPLPAVLAGNTMTKVYKAGDMIDMRGNGVDTGTKRSVSASPSALSFDLKETFGTTVSGTVTYTVSRANAREIRKILRRNRYVVIDCSTAGTTGPFNLGFSDVLKINSIRKAASFTTVNDGTNVTTNFVLDNGQRDNYYGNARITPYTVLTSGDKLLVCLDYFEPDYTLGVGYFSVDSYPVNDSNPASDEITTAQIPVFVSPDTSSAFDLRNYFDFRPVYTNMAADSTTLGGATTNPTQSTTLQYESTGLRLPADSENIVYDYSFYLARKDIVTLNKNGEFMVIKGIPASVPITPACPPHLMSVAKLTISPYPSLSPNYAKNLGKGSLACASERTAQVRFTMKDIGVLKQRVDNLENYVSLSLLEKSALDMKILDEQGLDRFKNGIFVDSFTSFSLSDTSNPDHHICYDPKEGSIRPMFESQGIGYDEYTGTNVVIRSNLLMLPYSEAVAVRQPYATTIRNVETTVYRFVGNLYLDPESDYWVNTDRLAAQTFNFGATDADVTPYSIVYGSWQTVLTGVTTTDPLLVASSSTSTSVNIGSSGSAVYGMNFAQNYAGSAAVINSLIATYGASTPVTMSGASAGGSQALGAGYPLSAWLPNVKTLGDVLNNAAKLAALNNFGITVNTTAGKTVTTSTTNTFQTITTTGTQATRSFTEAFQTLQVQTQSIGDKVVTVAPIADIRPQTIAFEARGIKSTTRHYVYFDGQLMSDYVTPGTMTNVPSGLGSNTNAALITATGTEGSSLYSNDKGVVYGFLRLPADASKTFRTGSKEVIVTDSPTNEPDATSSAKAYFHAQGITQTVQETILSTGHVVTQTVNGVQKQPVVYSNTSNTYTTLNVSVSNVAPQATVAVWDTISCMAYSFKLNTPNNEEGTFLSSIDTYFAAKDPTLGVWFEIRAMDNAGNITKVQVPGSEVWLSSNQVALSDNATVATNVKFKAPVFLQNNQEYAFVIHTVGINPNYYMHVCVLGENDTITKQPVTSRPLTGSLFTTNNNTDWDIVPRVDLKCTFYRAKFQTGIIGEAILGNQQREYIKLPLTPATGANTSWFGDRIKGNDDLTLSTPSGGTITVGDRLIGTNTSTNCSVSSINGSVYSMDNEGFEEGESISVRRANGLLTSVSTSVITKKCATGKIYKVSPKNDEHQFNGNCALLVVKDSNGLFKSNDTLHLELSSNTVTTNAISKFVYSTVQFEPSYIDFLPTTCDFSMLTVSNTGSIGDYQSIVNSNIIDFDEEKAIFSRTTEISTFGGAPSNRVKVQMTTVSDYLSPIVNLDRTYSVYIHNLINSNTANEILPIGGSLKDKYISQVITLADGQDAEDLKVILTAYRPPTANADMKVYMRASNGEDFESIYARQWIELEASDLTVYSSLANRRDFREFQYSIPIANMPGSNDQGSPIFGYTNDAGTAFQTFKQYQIKIGLQSDTSAIFPRVADLRCIALQK